MTNTIQEFTKALKQALDPNGIVFAVDVKGHWSQGDGKMRWSLTYNGSFSRDDLNALDKVAQEQDCYYEVSNSGAMFTLDLPYATNYQAMIKKNAPTENQKKENI